MVVQDDNLSSEVLYSSGGLILGIRGNISSLDVLHRHVLDVETNIVSGSGLGERLMVHLNGLNLSGQHVGGESDDHAGLDNTSLDTAHWHCSNTSNFVNILEGKPKRLVCRSLWWMIESRASSRVVPLALPSLRSTFHPLYQHMLVLVCNMLSPCQPEMGTNGTATGLYPTFLIKPETSFWISSNLAWLYGGSVESILLTATMSCLTPRV